MPQGKALERVDRAKAEQKAKERAQKKKTAHAANAASKSAARSKDGGQRVRRSDREVSSLESLKDLTDLTPLVASQNASVDAVVGASVGLGISDSEPESQAGSASTLDSDEQGVVALDQLSEESEPELPAFLPDWILEEFDQSKKESHVGVVPRKNKQHPKPPPQKETENQSREVKARSARTSVVRSAATKVIVLPGFGEIHYYHGSASMTAFCHFHSGDCRKSRSTRAFAGSSGISGPSGVRAGQGRPLGMLAAWLRCAQDHTDQASHCDRIVTNLLNHSERKEARTWLMTHAGAEDMANSERPKNATDNDEEPLYIA